MNPDSLYDFQIEAKSWLQSPRSNNYGFSAEPYYGLIAHEMGLGKTAITLETLKDLIKDGKRILFLVPGATTIQWQKQFDKWVLDCEPDEFGTTSLFAIRGSKSPIPRNMCCVMSHNLLAKAIIVERLAAANFDGIVIDEIHKFGSTGTKRIKHLWALINLTESHFEACRIGMSGTPVRNYAKEIYNIAHFLDPLRFRTQEDFARKYLTYDWKALSRPQQFHDDFAPYYLRRTVAEVQKSLPSIRRTKLYTEITDHRLVALYNKNLDLMANYTNNSGRVEAFSLLAYLIKLRHITGIAKAYEPSIIEPMLEYLQGDDDNPKKIVIGIHHHLVARRLKNSELGNCKCGHSRMSHFELDDDFNDIALDSCKHCLCTQYESAIKFFMIRGGMTDSQKEKEKLDFIACDAPAILLLSIKAAGEGIDGLQYAAYKAYVFERQWNGADEMQFEKRIHRTGQTHPCHIEYTIASGTVDEFFDEMVEEKRKYTTQVEDVNWESNPAFLRKLAEKVINSRLSVPTKHDDFEDLNRVLKPKEDISKAMDLIDAEI